MYVMWTETIRNLFEKTCALIQNHYLNTKFDKRQESGGGFSMSLPCLSCWGGCDCARRLRSSTGEALGNYNGFDDMMMCDQVIQLDQWILAILLCRIELLTIAWISECWFVMPVEVVTPYPELPSATVELWLWHVTTPWQWDLPGWSWVCSSERSQH